MTPPIHIIADDREWQSDIHELLRGHPEVNLEIDRLPVGDFMVNEQLIVERKTLIDFSDSIQDGRLFTQLTKLANMPETCLLVLEGTNYQLTKTGLTKESMQGALNYITLFLGIHLLRVENTDETVKLMVFAGRKMDAIRKPKKIGQPKRNNGSNLSQKEKFQINTLCNIPGIGVEKARLLLSHFGNIKAVFNADLKQIMAAPGIGKKLAENIYKIAN